MKFLEKDLEQIIWETNSEKLQQRGLEFTGKRFRQLRIGNYGVADLVTVKKEYKSEFNSGLTITIYELKKDNIGVSAFFQALSYARGIQRYFDKRKNTIGYEIKIVLIGKEIDTSGSLSYIPNLIYNYDNNCFSDSIVDVSFFTYSYEIDGLSFESRFGFKLIDEGF